LELTSTLRVLPLGKAPAKPAGAVPWNGAGGYPMNQDRVLQIGAAAALAVGNE
jgi:hypothetical protein